MNSELGGFVPGENDGSWNAAVKARCCSAMTRREIRYVNVSIRPGIRLTPAMDAELTERSIVFMNLSSSSESIRPLHSITAMASFGMTVKWARSMELMDWQNWSFCSRVTISRWLLKVSKARKYKS